jgi:predicted RNase H-like HicB family nuclease
MTQKISFTYEFDREEDGRWIAEIPQVPGAIAYGDDPDQAAARAEAIALRTLADQIESSGQRIEFAAAWVTGRVANLKRSTGAFEHRLAPQKPIRIS